MEGDELKYGESESVWCGERTGDSVGRGWEEVGPGSEFGFFSL